MPFSRARFTLIAPVALVALAQPVLAQPVSDGWGGNRWGRSWQDGGSQYGDGRVATQGNAEPSKKVEVETFRAADAGDRLGKGRIVVASMPAPPSGAPGAPTGSDGPTLVSPDEGAGSDWKLPVYEAAVVDQLAGKGYDIAHAADPDQIIEIAVSHDTVVPEEAPHKPISGEMSTTISNRGSGFGLAIAVDLSKPKKAIIATRLDVRIRDKASGKVLWEGHAQGQSRDTDDGRDATRMSSRLASALFAKFPEGKLVQPLPGTAGLTPAPPPPE